MKIDQKYQKCALVEINNAKDKMIPNQLVSDFVVHGTSTFYNFDNPKNNMRLDANIHEFSPSGVLSGEFTIKIKGKKNG